MKSFFLASNKDSFGLTRRKESIKYKMKGFYFAPHGDSFRLTKRNELVIKEVSYTSQVVEPTAKMKGFYFAPHGGSFRFTPQNKFVTAEIPKTSEAVELVDYSNSESENNIKDSKRRDFLKIAGVAGLGFAATALFPKKADALILGGTPTSSVVGVKDVANTRINPATEETASSLLKTSDLTFDAGALQVKVTSLPATGGSSFSDSGDVSRSALVDADRHVQVDVLSSTLPTSASTETTLQTISFGGFKFTLRFVTVGEVDYIGEAAIGTATSASSWRVKKVDSTTGIIIQWAGDGSFEHVWDNYASLSYS